jgi:hypothetical protein
MTSGKHLPWVGEITTLRFTASKRSESIEKKTRPAEACQQNRVDPLSGPDGGRGGQLLYRLEPRTLPRVNPFCHPLTRITR